MSNKQIPICRTACSNDTERVRAVTKTTAPSTHCQRALPAKFQIVGLLDQLEFGEVRMKIEKCTKDAFVVIGKEGSTLDGQGFIQKLWTDANSHFSEVQPLAKKDENGNLVGIWGAMSDCSHSYKPWEENFSKGLYLAGVECVDDAEAPEGWTKWKIPGYEYLYAEVESESTFSIVLDYMNTNNIVLAGAVHDFTCPLDGKNYMFFPIRTI